MRCFGRQVIALAVALIIADVTYANTAFNYNQLELGAGITAFNAPHYAGQIKYKGVAGFRLFGSYQFSENIIASLARDSRRNSGYGTDLTLDSGAFSLGLVTPVEPSIDAGVGISFLSRTTESCDVSCIKYDDKGSSIEIFVNSWLAENIELDVNLANNSWNDAGNHSSGSIAIGKYAGTDRHHRLGISFGRNSEGDDYFLIGYAYKFKNPFSKSPRLDTTSKGRVDEASGRIKAVPVDDELARPPAIVNIND